MEDRDIIELYFQRDERAITATAMKYGKLCLKIANNILGDEHEADECVNDTYYGIWRAIPPERPNCFRAFAAKIARNSSLRRLKRKNANKRTCEALASLDELEEIIADKSEHNEIEDRELGRIISDFLYTEKEESRNMFLRKYWFFDSISDIASRFGCSEAKVKSALFHTRGRLREYLIKKGVYI